jgi:hypothetical protein
MFKTSFCAVPAFMRVEPVTTSGPTRGAITTSASKRASEEGLAVTTIVTAPTLRPYSTAPIGYGVRRLAMMPTTTSLAPRRFFRSAATAAPASSSAPSTERTSARRPPAMIPCTRLRGVPNVGGHSAASSTPRRPLVPAPT